MQHVTGRVTGAILAIACALAPASLPAQTESSVIVISGGTLIDGNGGPPVPNAVVVIEDNRISTVSTTGQASYPSDATVIDAEGK